MKCYWRSFLDGVIRGVLRAVHLLFLASATVFAFLASAWALQGIYDIYSSPFAPRFLSFAPDGIVSPGAIMLTLATACVIAAAVALMEGK